MFGLYNSRYWIALCRPAKDLVTIVMYANFHVICLLFVLAFATIPNVNSPSLFTHCFVFAGRSYMDQ